MQVSDLFQTNAKISLLFDQSSNYFLGRSGKQQSDAAISSVIICISKRQSFVGHPSFIGAIDLLSIVFCEPV